VTITVDPEYDTVEQLKKQADVFQVDPDRWLFVTGPKDKVYDLIQKGFKQAAWENVGTDKKPGMEFAHSLNMVQVDANGVIVGKYDGRSEDEIETLAKVLEGKKPVPAANKPAAITTEKPKTVAGAAPDRGPVPEWVTRLPGTNAMLNTLAFLLLIGGRSAIRVGNVRLHSKLMIYAFVTSMVFLASYLTYHGALRHYTGEGSRKYAGEGILRPFYYTILVTHVILAALVPFGAIAAISLALRKKFDAHKRLVKFVYPLWVYVSVTGVVIYLMLYQLPTKI
jgi:protein SCO1/2/putative membrane protein